MAKLGKAGIVGAMILAFLAYFLSESLLRQATVSNINPQSVNVDSLMTKLPASVRESVNSKVETTRLRNAIKFAANDSDKVLAIINYAEYSKAPGQRLWLYSELLKEYPSNPECYRVYSRFLYNEGDGPSFKIEDYHSFLSLFDQMTAYNMWISGVNRIIALKLSPADELKFLAPLLSLKPEYREYGRLYQEIARIADKATEKEGETPKPGAKKPKSPTVEKAEALADYCRSLPTMDDALKRKLDDPKASNPKDAAKAQKPGKGA